MAIRLHPSIHVHPGDWIRTEIIEAHGLSVNEAADHLGVTRQTVSRLLNARQNLTADMAIRLEKVFGVKADTLLRMQIAHELAEARSHEKRLIVKALETARPVASHAARSRTTAASCSTSTLPA